MQLHKFRIIHDFSSTWIAMEVLESHMTERLRLSSCLVNDVCLNSGDLSAPTIRASAATSNSVAFGVAELSAKVAAAKEDVGRFKEDLEWVREFEIIMHSRRILLGRPSDNCQLDEP